MPEKEVDFSLLVGPEVPTREFGKGDLIFREGEQGDEFFVVVRGKVEITSGNRHLGDFSAKTAFLARWPSSTTVRAARPVVALTDCTVAPIREKQFLFLVRHTPFFALRVMRVIAMRLRKQNKAV